MAIDEEFDPVASASRPSRHKLREAKQAALNGTKLKLSVSQQRKANLPGHESGPGWDRELDSDPDEPLAIEEQFILRVPDALAPELRGMVESRNVNGDLWFKFKDSRRAVFHLGKKLYGAKLVDLPALVESQKLTGSGGAAVKVADISQMLLVEEEIKEEAEVTKDKAFNIEDFIFPHGITPPLKHVRKRRFRKRVNKRTIEVVESAVEKLLEDDARADDVKYELLDHDPSDSEYGSDGPPDAPLSIKLGKRAAPAAVETFPGDEQEEEEEEEEGAGSGFDSDLADEINKGMEAMNASAAVSEQSHSDDEGGDGGLFGGSSEEDDDDEEDTPEELEQKRRVKLLLEEVGDLDRAISAKQVELAKAMNPIFKKRFEDTIKKLTTDRDVKKAQHASAVREAEKKKATAIALEASAPPPPVVEAPVRPVVQVAVPSTSQNPQILIDEDDDGMDES